MRIFAATVAGLLLSAASFALLVAANEATDAAAIAGGTGLVIAGALLGLTFLASRWRAGSRAYTSTIVDSSGFYEDLAATFDSVQETGGYEGAAAG